MELAEDMSDDWFREKIRMFDQALEKIRKALDYRKEGIRLEGRLTLASAAPRRRFRWIVEAAAAESYHPAAREITKGRAHGSEAKLVETAL